MSFFDNWLTKDQVVANLKAEANSIFTKLGHNRMSGWVFHKNLFMARCHDCNMAAIVDPRNFNAASIRGEALTFTCTKKG